MTFGCACESCKSGSVYYCIKVRCGLIGSYVMNGSGLTESATGVHLDVCEARGSAGHSSQFLACFGNMIGDDELCGYNFDVAAAPGPTFRHLSRLMSWDDERE